MVLPRTIVMLKKNRHHQNHSKTAGQASEIGQSLFEQCIYVLLLLREK